MGAGSAGIEGTGLRRARLTGEEEPPRAAAGPVEGEPGVGEVARVGEAARPVPPLVLALMPVLALIAEPTLELGGNAALPLSLTLALALPPGDRPLLGEPGRA